MTFFCEFLCSLLNSFSEDIAVVGLYQLMSKANIRKYGAECSARFQRILRTFLKGEFAALFVLLFQEILDDKNTL